MKPFIAVGVGPVIGHGSGTFIDNNTISTGSVTRATLGGHIGGGLDVHVARSFSIGLSVGYIGMLNFSEPIGLHDNFNGAQVAVGIGWLFGKGTDNK